MACSDQHGPLRADVVLLQLLLHPALAPPGIVEGEALLERGGRLGNSGTHGGPFSGGERE